jgi:hypothetical protein
MADAGILGVSGDRTGSLIVMASPMGRHRTEESDGTPDDRQASRAFGFPENSRLGRAG